MWGADGIGRHVGFKIPCRKAFEFESRVPYHNINNLCRSLIKVIRRSGLFIRKEWIYFLVISQNLFFKHCRNLVVVCRNTTIMCKKNSVST